MNTLEFVKHAIQDPELCEKMASCSTPEQAYELASGVGLTDSLEDFVETMTKVREQVSELSENDLDGLNAAGDMTESITVTAASAVTCSVAAAAMM